MRIRAIAVNNDMFGACGGQFTTCNFLAGARIAGWEKDWSYRLRDPASWLRGRVLYRVSKKARVVFCQEKACSSSHLYYINITYGNEGVGVSDERFKADVVLQFAYFCHAATDSELSKMCRIRPCYFPTITPIRFA